MELLKDCKDFFKAIRSDTAFNEMLCDARELANEIDIPANFELTQPRHRVRRRNVNFDYEARDDPTENPTLKYKTEFHFFTLDKAINALESRKWNSTSTEFLAQFSEHSSHDTRVEFSKDSNESSKVLGLFWNSSNETFGFQPSLELTPPLTKRRILSESSKIFDPLGPLPLCTVFMKIFYQKLWLTKTDWDSPIPQQLTDDRFKFQKSFNEINYLPVPRWVILTADNTGELHDIASRGTDPKCLPDCILWWQGPPWLRLETSSWPKAEFRFNEASDELKVEQKSDSTFNLFTHTSNNVIHDLFEHYSSLTKEEIQSIKKQISPTPKSPLRSFHPFIDEHGILRVGGRLQNSQFRFNSKHPIILPSQHTISEFLIKEQHIAHLHAGPTLLAHVPRQSP
ncbi:uncharacterized protein TNCV_2461421 [Trichonephila clavipes]|nr:uncharacterized protein TNCV_2461421 [Trichonephila clavipes]